MNEVVQSREVGSERGGRGGGSAGAGLLLLLALLPEGARALRCRGFEGYSECGDPSDQFRDATLDVAGCADEVRVAGHCVCTQDGCDAEANLVRVQTECAAEGAVGPTCEALCQGYESDLWLLGMGSSICASVSTASGLVVQKIAHMRTQSLPLDKRPPMVFGFIISPLWILGFFLLVILPLPFNLLAVTWAAASLVAPLSSVTLVLNQLFAPCTLNERLTRTDVIATAVIVGGVVLATAFGTHCESTYAPEDLVALYARPPFLVLFALIVLAVVVAFFTARRWRKAQPRVLQSEDGHRIQAPTRVTISYAFMAGAYGAVMQIVFKGTGELVGAAAFDSPALWVSAVAIVPLATAQMAYLNVGMQVCNAVKFFPSYNASLIVLMTLTGMIYYECACRHPSVDIIWLTCS